MARLYVDDVRRTGDRTSTPDGPWERTYGYLDTIQRLLRGDITHISLDHDLDAEGELRNELTGYDIACWIEEQAATGRRLGRMTWEVHSMNPSGASRIRQAMQSADRYWSEGPKGLDKAH